MLGWLIITGVFVILLIGLIIWGCLDDWYSEALGITAFIIGVVIFVGCLGMLLGGLSSREEVNSFKNYQIMVEEVYQDGDITDTALNIKIVEMNQWLTEARTKDETYGIFSFYHGKIDDLEYITIGSQEVEE